ncbi:MAG TPA: glycosyltransferase family 4 protein [Candidatus Nanoarchaeia archaeon]|nr:glycosyltransferase family 4 protein [Candidatus Nanoarchaeia archaeon]
MKKLLIATDSFLPRWDGIARFLSEIIPRIAADFQVTVVAPGFPGEEVEMPGIQLIRIPVFGFSIGDFTPARFRLRLIKKACAEADIIWTQTIGPIGGAAIHYGRKLRKPVIAYIHSLEWELVTKSIGARHLKSMVYHALTKRIAQRLYNQCTILMVPSQEISEIITWEGIRTVKTVVRMGTDIRRFTPAQSKRLAKQQLGLDMDRQVIGFVGRLGREKDPRTLYRAFIRLRKHYPVHLLVVGKGVQELEALFQGKQGVTWVPKTAEVEKCLQAMDVYVLPSLTETSSLSTIEAMACGIPVIVTEVGALKEYIQDRYNGVFFRKQDPVDLAKKIAIMLDDRQLQESLSANARFTAVSQFNFEQTAAEIKKVLALYGQA